MTLTLEDLVRENIKKLVPYSSARSEFKGSGILLDANENPYGQYNRYPDPFQLELKAKLASVKSVRPEQIFLGNGSDGIVDLTYRIFCEPGKDKALSFPPSFLMYDVAANINAVDLIKVPLTENFQINRQDLEPHLNNPDLKVIFICSPNNPTGNLMHTEDIDYILNRFKGIVVLDEAYIDFSEQASYSSKLDQYPNLVILQTLSKAWGLAGGRLGMALMSPELVHFYNKVKTPYNISAINQEYALKTLDDVALFKTHLNAILEEKKKVVTALENSPLIKKVYPSDTNFMFVEAYNGPQLYQDLIAHNIIVRNQDRVRKNCLRITTGSPEENIKLFEALTALA